LYSGNKKSTDEPSYFEGSGYKDAALVNELSQASYFTLSFSGEVWDRDGDVSYAAAFPGCVEAFSVVVGFPDRPPKTLVDYPEYEQCRDTIEAIRSDRPVYFEHAGDCGKIEEWSTFETTMILKRGEGWNKPT
jgi:hypothetical protein